MNSRFLWTKTSPSPLSTATQPKRSASVNLVSLIAQAQHPDGPAASLCISASCATCADSGLLRHHLQTPQAKPPRLLPLGAGYEKCGKICIDPDVQCCVSNPSLGVQCGDITSSGNGTYVCPKDGGNCTLSCDPLSKCGDVCYDKSTHCCANDTRSIVGVKINGGCYGGNRCPITYMSYHGGGPVYVTIVGEKLRVSNVCSCHPTACGCSLHQC